MVSGWGHPLVFWVYTPGVASGKVSPTSAQVSSCEPLSTTMTSAGNVVIAPAKDDKHAVISAAEFQVKITIETVLLLETAPVGKPLFPLCPSLAYPLASVLCPVYCVMVA